MCQGIAACSSARHLSKHPEQRGHNNICINYSFQRSHHSMLAIINFKSSNLPFTVLHVRNFNYLELKIPASSLRRMPGFAGFVQALEKLMELTNLFRVFVNIFN